MCDRNLHITFTPPRGVEVVCAKLLVIMELFVEQDNFVKFQ